MEKNFILYTGSSTFATYDEAVEAAKRKAQRDGYDTLPIYEKVAFVQTPTPSFEVVKL